METKQLSEQLERLVDLTSLQDVLLSLAETCREKSKHIDEAWQDRGLAKYWEGRAKAIDRIAATCEV